MTKSSSRSILDSGLNRPEHEVADIVFKFSRKYQDTYEVSVTQKRILDDILYCRTVGMGGHVSRCDQCSHLEISYNSCRNRHCPKCQSLYKARWLEDRRADLLPVKYLHCVFTLPHELNDLILYNKKVLLKALFSAVKHTLSLFSQDPQYGLVGQLGYTAVLHTWDQKMNLHYHLHCIVPAGVYQRDEGTWIEAPHKFLFPVKALSRVFKGKYVSLIRNAYKRGNLHFSGTVDHLNNPAMFSDLLSAVMAKEWVVYAKRPFKSAAFVLDYLGRYTHRVAIANHRLVDISDRRVQFSYKVRNFKGKRYTCKTEICDLSGEAFLQRFLLHELPCGFMRIRHFGFLGNKVKKETLKAIRGTLGESPPKKKKVLKRSTAELMLELTGIDITLCSKCKQGKLRKIDEFEGRYRRYPFPCRGRPKPVV